MSACGRCMLPSAPGTPAKSGPVPSSSSPSQVAVPPDFRTTQPRTVAAVGHVGSRAAPRADSLSQALPLDLSNSYEGGSSTDSSQNVTVSVRVRTLNKREQALNSPNVIAMHGRMHPEKQKENK
eukprot:m.9801 g.9801  ORF g.9801 m.9801 type:complete len:124 (+) comp9504_c0_seq5:276-647(+)